MNARFVGLLALLHCSALTAAEPLLDSWFGANSRQYARIRTTASATPSTWTGQTLPVYADIQQIDFSDTFVYVRASGLASHVMGPWYLNAAHTQEFPNKPVNQNRTVRFARAAPGEANPKTNTPLGVIGIYVNGSGIYNMLDAFSYSGTSQSDAGMGGGGGVWNRDAFIGEVATFDANNAHQPGNGDYHAHINPIVLRYQLGDRVIFNGSTYAEAGAGPTHSPIIGWSFDGYPIYGPYGYADANGPSLGVRRMVSGYVKRTGQFGTANLASTGRNTLPTWAQIAQNRTTLTAAQFGPATTKPNDAQGLSYGIGRYAEDWDHLADLPPAGTAGASWDLDRYNGRQCVTPEFPGGTYAYFTTINADGTPAFPYLLGRQYRGTVTGGRVTSITEPVTNHFTGGKNAAIALQPPAVTPGGNVTLTWSSAEGGTYVLSTSADLQGFSGGVAATATGGTMQASEPTGGANATRFYKVTRTGLANSSN